ncbi:MAG: hypothetical protein EXQ58_03380 [Acidobacteria bacterium]|nr:hypothetical protein [Acidobacteriota bacterium]
MRRRGLCRSGYGWISGRYFSGLLLSWLCVTALSPFNSFAQTDTEEERDPRLLSVFPFTAQRGQAVKAEVRGNWLDGASGVWFDQGGFTCRIRSIEEIEDPVKQKVNPLEKPKKPVPLYRALIEVQIEPKTQPGVYSLRLVSHRGVSNPLNVHVVDSSVAVETPGSHQTVEQSMPVVLPGFISGKIEKPGEVDSYSFQAKKGQQFRFESIKGPDPDAGTALFAQELALYRAGGSWFDPHRPTRILFEEERSSDLMHVEAQGTYRFTEDGQYFLQVAGVFGQGCPDCTYQVRVFPHERPAGFTARSERFQSEWSERNLSRNLVDNWMAQLEARSVQASETRMPAKPVSASPRSSADSLVGREAKQVPTVPSQPLAIVERESPQTVSISLPAIVEGTIEHPGDLDSFKFKVDAGQKLAFEVETPDAKPPYFNPRVGVVDSQDQELFSNVERRLSMFNNNAEPEVYLKPVGSKAIYSFEHGGEHVLQVRDITSRYGNPNYRYRILVRPQIPHVGEISVMARDSVGVNTPGSGINRINLVRQEPKKLILVASYEEGFTGDLSFTFTGLPEGVQALPAVQFNEGRAPNEVTQNSDVIAPKLQKTAIVLLASPEAPLTTEPRVIQLHCQPISKGKLGPKLLVREIPLMVVAGSKQTEGENPHPEN